MVAQPPNTSGATPPPAIPQYYAPNDPATFAAPLSISTADANQFAGGIAGLASKGYIPVPPGGVPPVAPVVPPSGGTPPASGTPPGPTDYAAGFAAFQAAQPNQPDYTALTQDAQASEDMITSDRKQAIQDAAQADIDARQELGKNTESGFAAGLGMTQGLNWTSSGQIQLQGIAQQTISDINDIKNKEQAALSTADANGFEETQTALSNLRTQQDAHEANLFSIYNSIVKNNQTDAEDAATVQKNTAGTVNQLLTTFAGADFQNLPQNIQDGLNKLAEQAGLPAGFITSGLTSLKELQQRQNALIAQNKLDTQTAMAEMKAYVDAATRSAQGVTVNIPGLGSVVGTNPRPDSVGGSAAAGEPVRTPLVDPSTGNQVGYIEQGKEAGAKPQYFDMDGNPIVRPKNAQAQKTPTEKTPAPGSADSWITQLINGATSTADFTP